MFGHFFLDIFEVLNMLDIFDTSNTLIRPYLVVICYRGDAFWTRVVQRKVWIVDMKLLIGHLKPQGVSSTNWSGLSMLLKGVGQICSDMSTSSHWGDGRKVRVCQVVLCDQAPSCTSILEPYHIAPNKGCQGVNYLHLPAMWNLSFARAFKDNWE